MFLSTAASKLLINLRLSASICGEKPLLGGCRACRAALWYQNVASPETAAHP